MELDRVVGAVHSAFGLSAQQQTTRLLRAMDHPCFEVLAHPTGRLMGERLPCAMDTGHVLRGTLERGCFAEVNSQPDRLDLNDVLCRNAKEIGLEVAVSTDAHGCGDLDLLRFGVDQARRGWLEASDVLNTRSWIGLRSLLRKRRRS